MANLLRLIIKMRPEPKGKTKKKKKKKDKKAHVEEEPVSEDVKLKRKMFPGLAMANDPNYAKVSMVRGNGGWWVRWGWLGPMIPSITR